MMGMQSHFVPIVSFVCELMFSKNKHFALRFLQKELERQIIRINFSGFFLLYGNMENSFCFGLSF